MFLELIATLVAGFACAGLVLVLNLMTNRRLPKWVMPVVAGLGMIAVTISNEYTWFSRTSATLPSALDVALTVPEQSWFRPWTQVWPYTKRFVAVDRDTARKHPDLPDLRLVDLYFFGRWSPVNRAPMLFDCGAYRSALLVDGAVFAEDGSVQDADWQSMEANDPLLTSACQT